MATDKKIKISELMLDPENPRIESESGQINVRQAVIDDQGSKILELAADIVTYGLNPMDRMMILQPDPSKKSYVCLEGNRRTAALQFLAKPELLNDLAVPDAFRSRLNELADDFDKASVEPINCVLMSDRESARRWIELRHTGENDGRGIVDWNGVQTARFRGDKTLELLDFVRDHGGLSDLELNALKKAFPITTLDRIVSNPGVRTKLGLQIVDGEFRTEYKGEALLPVLKRIVLDLAQKKINVTAVKTSEQQLKYVNSIPKTVFPSGPKLKKPILVATSIGSPKPIPSPSPAPKPTPTPSPLDRKTFVPAGYSLSIENQKAAQLFFELRSLNLERYPIAGAMLLRGLLEASADLYGSNHKLPTHHTSGKNQGKPFSLAEKTNQCIDHLFEKKMLTKSQKTASHNTLINPNSVVSASRLHEYVHNSAQFPSKSDLVSSWSGIEAYLKALYK